MASKPPNLDLPSRMKRTAKKAIVLAAIKLTHAQEIALLGIYLQVVKLWEEAVPRIVAAYAESENDTHSNGPGAAAQKSAIEER